jgi:UDP-N-acetylmuramoylalanine--D-glutamate ligase
MRVDGKSFLVLGLGKTGQAAVRALEKAKATVLTWDDVEDNQKEGDPKSASQYPHRPCRNSPRKPADIPWDTLQAVIASPGVSFSWPRPHPVIEEARRRFVPILSDVDVLHFLAPQATYIAITGTNGKSTATAWLGQALENCIVGGNIGLPALDFPLLEGKQGRYVLELSSYQLEISQYPFYDISVLLNITPDHLTRHGGMEGYITAKRRIFMNPRGRAIVGIDDSHGRDLFQWIKKDSQRLVLPISGERVPEGGIGWQDGELVDARTGFPQKILSSKDILQGVHNQQNCAAVYAVAATCGMDPTEIKSRIRTFKGLEHRQEHVLSWNHVAFVNDSKATNADSVLPALKRFPGAHWIAGGRPKEDGSGKSWKTA